MCRGLDAFGWTRRWLADFLHDRGDLNPAVAKGVDHRLGAVLHIEFAEHRGDVVLDRLIGDAEDGGDFFV